MKGKKIIDQWTDRKDLTRHQRWKLRNPDKYKNTYTLYNIEHGDERLKKFRTKQTLKRIKTNQIHRSWMMTNGKKEEIRGLAARGKPLCDIAIWMNLPMSVISGIVNKPTKST